MPWSFIIPAAASLIGGSMQASATKDAANAANAQNQAALDLQYKMFKEQQALQEPWRQAGIGGLNRLTAGLAPGGEFDTKFSQTNWMQDPGYGFRLAEGQKALDRQLAAGGKMFGGGALKAGMNYNQGAASQEYQNAFNRFYTERANQLNPLQSLAGVGQTASNALTNAAGAYGTNASGIYGQMGQNTGNALLARGSTYGNMLGDIGQLYGRTKPNFGGLFGGGNSIGNTGLEGMSPNDLSYFFGG
jgi:hypothetical protein